MRNLKKILALVLAMVMSFSVMSIASADFKDQASVNEKYATAVDTLSALEVFKGYEDGNFNPKGTITRAEVAAIIYRIDTGDIYDEHVEIYADYGKFTDVSSTAWYAGYVNYCANAEYVKGVSDTEFNPTGKVTGYQALAMILRVVGYDQNDEFTGSAWQVEVASTAQALGLTKNVVNGETLGKTAATRELVAELLYRAILVPQVDYTLAFGYSQHKNPLDKTTLNPSIEQDKMGMYIAGTEKKNIAYGADDIWGRPGDAAWVAPLWTKDVLATYEVAPIVADHKAITECDIAAAMELQNAYNKVTDKYDIPTNVPVYVNGVLTVRPIDALHTNHNNATHLIGEQGTIIEVYEDRVVMIDTYLAQVTDTVKEKLDKKGHIIIAATNDIAVYDEYARNVNGKLEGELYTIAGNNYATGEYLLVNVYMGDVNLANPDGNNQTNDAINGGSRLFINGNPAELNGKQTKIWWNAEKHTIEGETILDNVNYILDAAQYDKDTTYRWFFDANGYVIGSTNVPVEVAAKNYAVVLGAQWINGTGVYGYAYGTIQYLDGTEPVGAVLNGIDFNGDGKVVGDEEFRYADTYSANFSEGTVCTTYQYNKNTYAHLYEVTENEDGSLNLKAVKDELATATLIDGVSQIDKSGYYTDLETVYYFYNAKTCGLDVVKGYINLPANYDAALVDIVYNANGFAAQFVYVPYWTVIENQVTAKETYGYYFITDDAMNYTLKDTFAVFGVVDVEGGTEPLQFSMNFAGSEEATEMYLDWMVEKYQNTLIYVKTVDGLVTEVTYITETKLVKDVMTTEKGKDENGKDVIIYKPLTTTETAYKTGDNAYLVAGKGTALHLDGGEYEFIKTGVLKCDVLKTVTNEDETVTEYFEADGLNVTENTVIVNENGVGTLSDMLTLDGEDLYVIYKGTTAIAIFIVPADIH